MIGPVGFATRNLQRRGFHALLAFVGLTVTTASTIFLLLIGQSLVSTLNVEFDSKSTLGISYLFLGYVMLALAFILIIGLVSAGYLVSTMINQRTRDIGVMKAAGCQTPRLFAYALTEALIVFLASSVAGGIASVILYISWTGTLGIDQTTTITIGGISILSFLLSYFAARFQVWRIVKSTASNAISSQLSSLDLKSVGKPFQVRRLGLAFNMASRTVLRNKRFGRTVLSISLCIFLSTIILTGAFVSWNTSKSYVEDAMPPHIFAMGRPQIVDQYVRLAQSFSTQTTVPIVNGFNSSNLFGSQIVNMTREIPGVSKVDARLMNMTTAEGSTSPQFVEDASGATVIVPSIYLGRAQVLFFGVDPNETVGVWHTSNGFLSPTDSLNTVVVGDSLIGGIVRQPLNGSEILALTGASFQVKGAVIDPLNRGRVIYAPLTRVQQLVTLGLHEYNLLLVKTDGSESSFQALENFAVQYGLEVASQDQIVSMSISFLDGLWTRIIILPVLTLVLAGAILLSYLSTNFSARFNDYTAIRVLGAKGGYVLKVLLWEGGGIVMFCALLALPLGIIFSAYFLVPTALVRAQDVELSGTLALLTLSIVAVGSALAYWRRLTRVTVKDLLP